MKPEETKKEVVCEESIIQNQKVEVDCEEENGMMPQQRIQGMRAYL